MTRRKRWIWTLIAIASALTVLLIAFASAVPLRSDSLKQRIVEYLSNRLQSDVTLDDLSLRLLPRLHAVGNGLVIRKRGQADVPPLIAVKQFTVDTGLLAAWRKHVAHVELVGLDIAIPPDRDGDEPTDDRKPERPHRLHDPEHAVQTMGTVQKPKPPNAAERGVVIDSLDSKDARIIIVRKDPGKDPKIWAIHTLAMTNVGVLESMPFDATLTNGIPPGEIVSKGHFGPWDTDNPGNTPLDGTFTFDNAKLDVFNGIAGTLSSKGAFDGSLSRIEVQGETDTPDFTIEVGGHPFALHTKYHSIVDGTNGDTRLERIDATFLQSTLIAKGAVLDGPKGEKGRTVTLDITMPKARIEDVMTMAVKAKKPPMFGAMRLTTKFLLPPGETDVAERLRLDGRFDLSNAKFTSPEVQQKIVELSHRGRGRKPEQEKENVASSFQGRFRLGGGRLALPEVSFGVPGAQVKLAGQYALKQETLAFKGDLLLDAKVSQTVSGFKSLLLKLADPFFKRPGGGSQIPIKIEGTRNDPKFGLDVRRVFKRGD